MAKPPEDSVKERVTPRKEAEATKHDAEGDIAEAIGKLSSHEAEFFLTKLEALMRKRKLQLTGYLVALGSWAIAMFFALAYYATHVGFVGWVFLLPFGLVGAILFAFGKWADRVGKGGGSPTAKVSSSPRDSK